MNIPGTDIYLRPTLEETIQGWTAIGFTKAEALQAVMRMRMLLNQPKGHGNKAARRMADIETARWFDDVEAELEARNPDAFAKQYAKDNKLNYHDL